MKAVDCDNDYGFLCISKFKKCGTTANENTFEERLWANTGSTAVVTGTNPGLTTLMSSINWIGGKPSGYTSNIRAEYYGMINISKPGTYTFYINSDDGSRMTLNGDTSFITSNWSSHGMVEKSASKSLAAGWHSIFLEFYQGGGGYGFKFSYAGPGIAKKIMAAPPLSCASESGSECEDSLVENEAMESVSISLGGASSSGTVNLQHSGSNLDGTSFYTESSPTNCPIS